MLMDRFGDFTRETEAIGSDRVAKANELCDSVIGQGHPDSPTIAEWKDRINDLWDDLRELCKTRTQQLQASYDFHKFHVDCRETLDRIMVISSHLVFSLFIVRKAGISLVINRVDLPVVAWKLSN